MIILQFAAFVYVAWVLVAIGSEAIVAAVKWVLSEGWRRGDQDSGCDAKRAA
jgi:hypothetical protein